MHDFGYMFLGEDFYGTTIKWGDYYMSEMRDYLKSRLDEFIRNYNVENKLNTCWDKDLKRQWKRDSDEVRSQWKNINSVADVQRYVDWFASTVARYENVKGIYTDAYDMDLSLFRAIYAIQKMAASYDNEKLDFHTFGKDEIDRLFSELYRVLKEMKEVNLRRAMQD